MNFLIFQLFIISWFYALLLIGGTPVLYFLIFINSIYHSRTISLQESHQEQTKTSCCRQLLSAFHDETDVSFYPLIRYIRQSSLARSCPDCTNGKEVPNKSNAWHSSPSNILETGDACRHLIHIFFIPEN